MCVFCSHVAPVRNVTRCLEECLTYSKGCEAMLRSSSQRYKGLLEDSQSFSEVVFKCQTTEHTNTIMRF